MNVITKQHTTMKEDKVIVAKYKNMHNFLNYCSNNILYVYSG